MDMRACLRALTLWCGNRKGDDREKKRVDLSRFVCSTPRGAGTPRQGNCAAFQQQCGTSVRGVQGWLADLPGRRIDDQQPCIASTEPSKVWLSPSSQPQVLADCCRYVRIRFL